VFKFRNGAGIADNTNEWCSEGIAPQIENLQGIVLNEELPWFAERILSDTVFHVPDVNTMPAEGRPEQKHFIEQDIQSLIVVPIKTDATVIGFLGFDAVRKMHSWFDFEQDFLCRTGETLAKALEKKNVYAAIHEGKTMLEMALAGTRAALWIWNVQTGETVFSERWAKILGYTLGELQPVSIQTWLDLCHPDDLTASTQILEKHFARELDYYECEARMKHKDGRWVWVHDRGKVYEWSETGKPLRMAGTHLDISARKRAEAEKEEAMLRLQEAMSKIKTLSGMLPICASCKKIRDDRGYWKQLESYIRDHSEADFSHSLCPECAVKLYPEFYKAE